MSEDEDKLIELLIDRTGIEDDREREKMTLLLRMFREKALRLHSYDVGDAEYDFLRPPEWPRRV